MIDRTLHQIESVSRAETEAKNARFTLFEQKQEAVQIPQGPVTRSEVIQGIRSLAYRGESESVQLRAWEIMGRDIGMFKDSAPEGGAPVVRVTPPLDEPADAGSRAVHERD